MQHFSTQQLSFALLVPRTSICALAKPVRDLSQRTRSSSSAAPHFYKSPHFAAGHRLPAASGAPETLITAEEFVIQTIAS